MNNKIVAFVIPALFALGCDDSTNNNNNKDGAVTPTVDMAMAANPPDMERYTRQLAILLSPPGFMVHRELGLFTMFRCHCA